MKGTPDKRSGAAFACSALIFASVFAPACRAQQERERHFIWNEANAVLAKARTTEDCLCAAEKYLGLVDRGVRNGPLFYNLGVALLNADMNEEALAAFLRAERYMDFSEDLALNMQVARTRLARGGKAAEPWYRVLLFWHFGLSCASRTLVAAAAFLIFWLALTLRAAGLIRRIQPVLFLALFILVLFGSSVATTVHQESVAPRPILSALAAPPNGPAH